MATVLVTGGCGFIGSNFIRHMLRKYPQYRIANLDKLTYAGNPQNLADLNGEERYSFTQGDICDAEVVDPLVKESEIIVNFAAESHVDRSILGGAEFIQTNIHGTCVLLESARKHGVERFYQISTDEVYGSIENGAWCEDEPLMPRNPYSASKASAELMVRAYHLNYGLPTLVSRASNNIGPYQYPEKRVPLYITNAIDELPLPVYGNGLQVRDHLYVGDHCAAIDLVLHQGAVGETYNIGGDNDATGLEVARSILERLDKSEDLIEFVDDRLGHDQRYAIDSSKIKALGWESQCDFQAAMTRTVDWYVEHGDWWREIKAGNDYRSYYRRQYGRSI